MPVLLKRENGKSTPFRNAEYLPAYYFMPREILSRCGKEVNLIPRNPQKAYRDKRVVEIIESDLFDQLMIDGYAYMVWPHMGVGPQMEIYSGYEPAWILAHGPAFWVQELTDIGMLPSAETLLKSCNEELHHVPLAEVDAILASVVPAVMEKHNMWAAIDTAREIRCFEDFDYRKSGQKTDFYRKWYHTRTAHPQISLEGYKEQYAQWNDGMEWDEPDEVTDVERGVVSQVQVEQFKAELSEKDRLILTLRMEGYTLDEIAAELGYQNHSGVLKRIRQIGKAYQHFTGDDLGFDGQKIV
mgnify:CR=1 FL=1